MWILSINIIANMSPSHNYYVTQLRLTSCHMGYLEVVHEAVGVDVTAFSSILFPGPHSQLQHNYKCLVKILLWLMAPLSKNSFVPLTKLIQAAMELAVQCGYIYTCLCLYVSVFVCGVCLHLCVSCTFCYMYVQGKESY